MKVGISSLICALVLVGCQAGSSPSTSANPPATSGQPAKDTKPAVSETKKATISHEGLEYLGLNGTTPTELELTSTAGMTASGKQSSKFVETKGGEDIYEMTRDGSLGVNLGDTQSVKVNAKGVYVTSLKGAPIDPPAMEMPAAPKAGDTWDLNLKAKIKEQTIDSKLHNKVVGVQKVKTKAGEFDALLVISNGTESVDGNTSQIETKTWYAKGKGEVKIEMAITTQGKKQTVTIEAAK